MTGALHSLTFVLSGTLESMDREAAKAYITQHDGIVRNAMSGKTSYLVLGNSGKPGSTALENAKKFKVPVIDETELFALVKKKQSPSSEIPINNSSSSRNNNNTTINIKKRKIATIEADEPNVKKSAPFIAPKSIQQPLQRQLPKMRKICNYVLATDNKDPVAQKDLLFVDKYRPHFVTQIIGNQIPVLSTQAYLKKRKDSMKSYRHLGAKKSSKTSKNKNTIRNNNNNNNSNKSNITKHVKADHNVILISGPAGCGKTTASTLLAKSMGFETVEINASDTRNAKLLTEKLESLGTHIYGRLVCIIMDEVDGVSAGDRGGIAALISFIKERLPNLPGLAIICICNQEFSQKIKSLKQYCDVIRFGKPTHQQVLSKLKEIASSEKLAGFPDSRLLDIAQQAQGDLRSAINSLQMGGLDSSIACKDNASTDLKTLTRRFFAPVISNNSKGSFSRPVEFQTNASGARIHDNNITRGNTTINSRATTTTNRTTINSNNRVNIYNNGNNYNNNSKNNNNCTTVGIYNNNNHNNNNNTQYTQIPKTIINTSDSWISIRLRDFYQNPDLLPAYVFENYANHVAPIIQNDAQRQLQIWIASNGITHGGNRNRKNSNSTKNNKRIVSPVVIDKNKILANAKTLSILDDMASAASSISDGDMISRHMYSNLPEGFELYDNYAVASTITPGYYTHKTTQGRSCTATPIDFPKLLGATSSQMKLKRQVVDLMRETLNASQYNSSIDDFQCVTMPLMMYHIQNAYSSSRNSSRVADNVIAALDELAITRDEEQLISDITGITSEPDGYKLDSLKRSEITRKYNATNHHLQILRKNPATEKQAKKSTVTGKEYGAMLATMGVVD